MPLHISRRHFLQHAMATGVGLGALTGCRDSVSPLLTVGICGPVHDHQDYAQSGYAYIEPTVQGFLVPEASEAEFQANLDLLRGSNLSVPVANSFLPSTLKVVGPEANHEAVLGYAETAFQRARIVGIEHIVFGSGGARYIPDEFSHDQARAQFVALLKKMAPLAARYGITLCLEPLRQQETNFLNTVPESMAVLHEVGHAHVQITFDIYHVTQEGRGVDDVHIAGGAIRHCHIAEDEDRRAPGVHGDDFTPYFAALKTIGYRGRISVECRWQERATELPAAAAELTRQLAMV